MTNKLVVIIKSLEVPKIKKILQYEMKFLVPNYSCLQNPWLGSYRPQIPVLPVLNWICWTPHEQNSWVRHWVPPYKIIFLVDLATGIFAFMKKKNLLAEVSDLRAIKFEDTIFLRKLRIQLRSETASYTRKTESSTTASWKTFRLVRLELCWSKEALKQIGKVMN